MMGEFDDFNAPVAAPAKEDSEFSEFDKPVATPAPEKRSFVSEAAHRTGEAVAAPFKGAADVVSNATLPTSLSDLGARIKQNVPLVGRALFEPIRSIGSQALAASDFAGRAVAHPVETFGDGKAPAVAREFLRGVNDNIPLANLAVEHMGGPAEESASDIAQAPGAREAGGLVGIPVSGAEAAIATKGAEKAANAIARTAEAVPRAMRRIPQMAAEKADEWLIKDIRGQMKGETTPTARKYLAADEEDVQHTLARDPELKKTLQDARHSDRKKLEAADAAVKAKIAEVNAPRAELYDKEIDGALGGGVRSGDFVQQIRNAAEEHRADGTPGGHKMANYLEARANELEHSRSWGYESAPELDAKAAADLRDLKTTRDNLAKRPGTEATVADLNNQIQAIEDRAPVSRKYNPDAIVPTRTVRKWVTDLQDVAYDGLGGLSDTRAAGQARVVAGNAADALNVHLDRAAQVNPEAVEKIRDINTQHSALKNIERVLDQRLNRAVSNAEGAGGPLPHSIKQLGAKVLGHGPTATAGLALASGHPAYAAAIAAVGAAPEISRMTSTQLARLAKSPRYRLMVQRVARAARATASRADFVRDALAGGMPGPQAAMIWDAAHGGSAEARQ